MYQSQKIVCAGAVAVVLALGACATQPSASANPMSFFVTSVNPGRGADLGGLSGADAYCETLAAQAGAGARNWRAYLSATASAGSAAVHARERIGRGPWQNVKGEIIAANVDELHDNNRLGKLSSLTEKGEIISGAGDAVTLHDILTGSTPEGRAADDGKDSTCGNWTQGEEGSAIVGHHDRKGLDESVAAKSWNSSHATRGCSLAHLKSTGGAGLLYCFAANK